MADPTRGAGFAMGIFSGNCQHMTLTRRDLAALSLAAPLAWAVGGPTQAAPRQALVIATGAGTADIIPEGTSAAFELAIHDGADFIAADFVPSRDGTLVALPDHELSALTDVASRREFASRKQAHTIEGADRTGWFAEDFTLAELKTLERTASPRARRDGKTAAHPILTFEEIVAIARAGSVRAARVIGVDAGISHSAYFAGLDLAVEPLLASAIRAAGYDSPAAAMFVSSADPAALKTAGELTRARRVLPIGAKDLEASGAGTPDGLKAIRAYAEAVAPDAGLLLDLSKPKAIATGSLMADAQAAGLAVHAWALAGTFPPPPFKTGDAQRLLAALFAGGADAVAGDHAAFIVRARAEAMSHPRR
jgi:glycerophosphoryl diester phosphodiesterase